MEDWGRGESKGLRDGGSPESGGGSPFNLLRARNGAWEGRKQVG